jgi:hypothetical protein
MDNLPATSPAYEDLGPTQRLTSSEQRVPPKIARIIGELGLRYRPSVQADLEAHATTLALLTRDVAQMRPETLERAAQRWAQTSPYMPKAAELIAMCRDLDRPSATQLERLERANASAALINIERAEQGLPPVRWVLKGGEIKIESY